MKKWILPLIALMICALFVAGCGTSATTQPSAATPAATQTAAPATVPQTSAAATPTGARPTATVTSASPATSTAPAPSGAKPVSGGTVRYATPYSPGNPTGVPWQTVGPTVVSSQLCLQGLLKEKMDGTSIPNLTASFEVNTDPAAPSIIFKLRKGVKFHDGTDFNAAAVKWNLEKQMAPGSTNIGNTTSWKSIEAVDDYTIKLSLKTWQNTLLASFANATSYMISPTAFEKNGLDWMQYHIVGTGPYVQKDFQRDVAMITTRNPNYWDTGKPYLDGIQMLYVADDLTRTALFKSGGTEVLDNGRNARLASELASAGYNIVIMPGSGNFALVPDSLNADSAWSNIKVRQAAEYSIDKEAMAKTFGYGYMHSLNQMYVPASPAYDTKIPGRNFDVAKAKQLLTEAGYPNGFKTSIIVSPMGVDRNMVLAVQAYLAKVGIQVELQFPQSGAYSLISTGTWKNALLYTPLQLWANPNQTFNYFFGVPGTNYLSLKRPDGWKDMLSTSMITAAPDPVLMKKMENALYDDVTVIPLTDSTYPWAVVDNLQDHGIGTYSTVAFWDPETARLVK